MKIKLIGVLLIFTVTVSGFKPVQNEETLPFILKYSLPLKTTGKEHLARYDYTEYTSGEDILQLKQYHNITREKARQMNEDRKYFILAMFRDQPNPYPGVLSNSIGCPKELQPQVKEDTIQARLFLKLMANSNLIFGNCAVSDNYYTCAYLLFFCPSKKAFFELKIYTPIKKPSFNYESLIASLRCN